MILSNMKRLIIFLFLSIFLLQIISADHQILPASFSVDNKTFSFSIQITDTDIESSAPLIVSNITKVNITLPGNMVFISGTNSTDSLSDFANNSFTLMWTNNSYVIGSSNGGDNIKYFSFNITINSTSPKKSNITVTTMNSTNIIRQNISITISDTTVPEVQLINPDDSVEEDSPGGITSFECSATDNLNLNTIGLYIYSNKTNETITVYNNNLNIKGISNDTIWNYTFNQNGNYIWNCFVNDSFGNNAWGTNRTIKINVIQACTQNWSCTNWGTCVSKVQTRICSDLNRCGNNLTKPNENQTCCTSQWNCTDWIPEKCPQNETQTRICSDLNDCSNATGKPSETNTCTYQNSTGIIVTIIIIAVVLIAGIIAALFFFRKKPTPPSPPISPAPYLPRPPQPPPSLNLPNQGYRPQ